MIRRQVLPLTIVLIALVICWYGGSLWLNGPSVIDRLNGLTPDWHWWDFVSLAWSLDRPLLPAPHQILFELWRSIFTLSPFEKRSLVYHAMVTASSTLAGFVLGVTFGMALAAGIVHNRTLDRTLMPWIIASQTVPILAIAPMIVVVLGNLGLTGILPKAVISMYLGFFPVAIGMVKGLRSPDRLQLDLMNTYRASNWQIFVKLRLPASLPFLFASLKVAIAISLVGAIVGELPTGASAGIGARLLSGSYYGQTIQIWAALFMSAILGLLFLLILALTERFYVRGRVGEAR